jgi:hypothetical protein
MRCGKQIGQSGATFTVALLQGRGQLAYRVLDMGKRPIGDVIAQQFGIRTY